MSTPDNALPPAMEHDGRSIQHQDKQDVVDTARDVSINDPPEVSSKVPDVLKEHRRQFNLAAFGTTFEGGALSKERGKSHKMMPKHEYDECVSVMRYWNISEGHNDPVTKQHVTQREFRRSRNRKWYRLGKVYKVTTSMAPDGTTMELLKRLDEKQLDGKQQLDQEEEKSPRWKLVAHEENAFDALHECHRIVGHKKTSSTRNEAARRYWNLTEELCKIFVTTCPECCHDPPKVKKLPGAKTPIHSGQFRDRFQADLIDYRSNPKCDVNGIEMKWLLVLKDHFTKFTMLRPIARKEAKLVLVWLCVQYILKNACIALVHTIFA